MHKEKTKLPRYSKNAAKDLESIQRIPCSFLGLICHWQGTKCIYRISEIKNKGNYCLHFLYSFCWKPSSLQILSLQAHSFFLKGSFGACWSLFRSPQTWIKSTIQNLFLHEENTNSSIREVHFWFLIRAIRNFLWTVLDFIHVNHQRINIDVSVLDLSIKDQMAILHKGRDFSTWGATARMPTIF